MNHHNAKVESEESTVSSPTFDDIADADLQHIVENVRIDGEHGEPPLNAIMMDIITAHNELEEYKRGCLSLYQALDERLEVEEMRENNEELITVLEEVKHSTFGVYLRLQRGDEELMGDRDGKYSNYFNK